MCKVISIVNQKGGCSKTTSAVNIGIGLANAGYLVFKVHEEPFIKPFTCRNVLGGLYNQLSKKVLKITKSQNFRI